MTEWLRVAFIVLIVAVDDLLRELASSAKGTGELARRFTWIVQDKVRATWRRSRSRPTGR